MCNADVVTEPNGQYTNLVRSSVPPGQTEADKYNFDDAFDWLPFIATSHVVKVNNRGKPVHDQKEFKTFFTTQDLHKIVPLSVMHPNFKNDLFLNWIQLVSMEASDLGKCVSINEHAIGFKGPHIDKMRISYKKEGDGFQCDTIWCHGYTYSFFYEEQTSQRRT
jgi:hypothetical protein